MAWPRINFCSTDRWSFRYIYLMIISMLSIQQSSQWYQIHRFSYQSDELNLVVFSIPFVKYDRSLTKSQICAHFTKRILNVIQNLYQNKSYVAYDMQHRVYNRRYIAICHTWNVLQNNLVSLWTKDFDKKWVV